MITTETETCWTTRYREARERARQQHVYDILASLRDANDPETVRAYRDEIEKRGFQVLNTGEAIRAVYAPDGVSVGGLAGDDYIRGRLSASLEDKPIPQRLVGLIGSLP